MGGGDSGSCAGALQGEVAVPVRFLILSGN